MQLEFYNNMARSKRLTKTITEFPVGTEVKINESKRHPR